MTESGSPDYYPKTTAEAKKRILSQMFWYGRPIDRRLNINFKVKKDFLNIKKDIETLYENLKRINQDYSPDENLSKQIIHYFRQLIKEGLSPQQIDQKVRKSIDEYIKKKKI
jgi:hypothetical protein